MTAPARISPWSGSARIPVRKVRVQVMPKCGVHPTVEPAEGCYAITWISVGTGIGYVECCRPCAEGASGRWQAAWDDSESDTEPVAELLVVAPAVVEQVAA